MNKTPQITEQKTLGHPNGSLRGNRFKLNNIWFRIIQCKLINKQYFHWVKNESTGAEKMISSDNLKRLKVDEISMIDPAEQFNKK